MKIAQFRLYKSPYQKAIKAMLMAVLLERSKKASNYLYLKLIPSFFATVSNKQMNGCARTIEDYLPVWKVINLQDES